MAKSLWQDHFVIDIYNLAKSGMTENQMSKTLGVSIHTFIKWEKKKKLFKLALDKGRKEHRGKDNKTLSFRDYFYKRLSYKNRKTWKAINKLDGKKGSFEKIEALLERRGKLVRQHMFVYAWVHANFSVSMALRKVCISRSTFEAWKKDNEFGKLIEELNWHKKNFFEDHLTKLVAGGNPAATIFVNKTFNKDRGYNEKIEVDMNLAGELEHGIVSVDHLKLDLDVRKALLKAKRKQRKEEQKSS